MWLGDIRTYFFYAANYHSTRARIFTWKSTNALTIHVCEMVQWPLLLVPLPLLVGFASARWPKPRTIRSESVATPPSAVFGVAWTTFYLVLGVLLYRQWLPVAVGQHVTGWRVAILTVLALHLVGTFAWTPLYASGRRRDALYLIVGVLATALALQMLLINHDQLFAVLLAPYVAWLVFALHLNYEAVSRQTD